MPYSEKAQYRHFRQKNPRLFNKATFRTVPLNHTEYRGKKFKGYMYSGTRAKAVVGKLKKSNKWSIQTILIPLR